PNPPIPPVTTAVRCAIAFLSFAWLIHRWASCAVVSQTVRRRASCPEQNWQCGQSSHEFITSRREFRPRNDDSVDRLQPGQHNHKQAGKIDQPEDKAELPEVSLADEAAAVIHRRGPRGIRRDDPHEAE